MAFVKEIAKPEDVAAYEAKMGVEIPLRVKVWSIDRERDIFLIDGGTDHYSRGGTGCMHLWLGYQNKLFHIIYDYDIDARKKTDAENFIRFAVLNISLYKKNDRTNKPDYTNDFSFDKEAFLCVLVEAFKNYRHYSSSFPYAPTASYNNDYMFRFSF